MSLLKEGNSEFLSDLNNELTGTVASSLPLQNDYMSVLENLSMSRTDTEVSNGSSGPAGINCLLNGGVSSNVQNNEQLLQSESSSLNEHDTANELNVSSVTGNAREGISEHSATDASSEHNQEEPE